MRSQAMTESDLFPPGWQARAIAWVVVRIVLVAAAFWLGGCAPGARI